MTPTDPAPAQLDDDRTGTGISVEDRVASTVSRSIVKWLATLGASGLVVLVGAGLLFWSSTQAQAARSEEVHRTLQRDATELAGDVEQHGHPEIAQDIAAIQRDVGILQTKIDSIGRDVEEIERLLRQRRR